MVPIIHGHACMFKPCARERHQDIILVDSVNMSLVTNNRLASSDLDTVLS